MIKRTCLAVLALTCASAVQAKQKSAFPVMPDHVTSGIQVEALDNASLGAAGIAARDLAPLPLNLIKDFESWVPDAYNDASMFCTIGYGHLIAKKACAISSKELAAYLRPMPMQAGLDLLDKDTKAARIAVQNLVHRPLSDEQFGAVVSFVFNVGAANFSSSTMLLYLNNGEYDGAARQFPKWVKSKGVVLNGLVTRRACEAALFSAKLPSHPNGEFMRADCASNGAAPSVDELIDIGVGETSHR